LTGEPQPDADEETLPRLLLELMHDVGVPTGLRELGYDVGDVDALVDGALKQQRLLVVSPREAGPEELGAILRASL
jgi:hydroxyacid-oxoacid transhydrogenase